jgi:hypothetical protein
MGGHGGKRIGAGRKPKSKKERWLAGNAGKVNLALVTHRPPVSTPQDVPAAEPLPEVPSPLLTPSEADLWAQWAPRARARGTLVPETEPGFAQLCEVASKAAKLWSWIDTVGLMFETVTVDGSGQEHRELRKHPLLTEWRGLEARKEMMLARYGLTGDGKVPASAEAGDAEELQLARILAVK